MATQEAGRGEEWKRYAVHQEGLFLLQSWERSAFHFRGACGPEAKESKADLPFLALTQYTHTHLHAHTLAHTDGILWGDCFGSVDQFEEKY